MTAEQRRFAHLGVERERVPYSTTRDLFAKSSIKPEQVESLAFRSQVQSSIFEDNDGRALRRSMVYLDHKGMVKMCGIDVWQVFTGTVRRMTIGERVKEIGMEGFDAYNPELPITMLTLDEPQEVHGMSGDGSGDVVSVMLDEVGVRNADELGLEDGAHVSLRTKVVSFPSSSYGAIQRVIGNFELV